MAAAAATAAGLSAMAAGWRRSRLLYSEYMDFSPAASRPYAGAGNAADVPPAEVSRENIGARRNAIDADRKSTSDTRSLTSVPGPHTMHHAFNTRLVFAALITCFARAGIVVEVSVCVSVCPRKNSETY